ncbi:MAG: threonine synthase, partial [Methylocella sp.]
MKYRSTRGAAPPVSFTEMLLAGLAPDGGLYLPATYPQLSQATIAGFAGKPYVEVAEAIIAPFVAGEIEAGALRGMIAAAYKNFRHKAIAPLTELDSNLFVLELFHGPTLA